MQPRNLLVVDAPLVEVEVAAGADVVAELVDPGALVVLLPQAAISRVVTAAAAVPIKAVCLTVILHWTRLCRCPGVTGLPPSPDCPKISSRSYPL
jgi:hypothetical protein